MLRRATTTTCYALLSVVLLVASLAFVVSSVNVNVKNGMANTNTIPEDNKVVKRKLTGESDTLMFSRTYIAVTKAADFTRSFPNGGDLVSYLDDFLIRNFKSNPEFPIQGSSTTQKGAVFDSSSIEVVNAKDGFKGPKLVNVLGPKFQLQFAGDRKLGFTPVDDPLYFFHGQCTATSGILEPPSPSLFPIDDIVIPQPVITSQTCRLNLCLGGGGFSCIAIYSGSAFVFNFGKGVALNNKVAAGLSPPPVPATFEAPPLPPPFPGTIIGGTGTFEGIEGSVTVTTIAGTTGPIVGFDSTIFKFRFGAGLKPIGSIVQVISVKSNMPLPPGP